MTQAPTPPYVKAGRLIRLFGWLTLFGLLAIGAIEILQFFDGKEPNFLAFSVPFAILACITIFQFLLGAAIKQHRDWGRIVGIIWAVLMLPGIPIGTIVGAYILWCLIKGWDQQPA